MSTSRTIDRDFLSRYPPPASSTTSSSRRMRRSRTYGPTSDHADAIDDLDSLRSTLRSLRRQEADQATLRSHSTLATNNNHGSVKRCWLLSYFLYISFKWNDDKIAATILTILNIIWVLLRDSGGQSHHHRPMNNNSKADLLNPLRPRSTSSRPSGKFSRPNPELVWAEVPFPEVAAGIAAPVPIVGVGWELWAAEVGGATDIWRNPNAEGGGHQYIINWRRIWWTKLQGTERLTSIQGFEQHSSIFQIKFFTGTIYSRELISCREENLYSEVPI